MRVSKAVSKDGLSVDLSSYAEDDCQSPEAQLVPVGSWFPTGDRDRFMDYPLIPEKKKIWSSKQFCSECFFYLLF